MDFTMYIKKQWTSKYNHLAERQELVIFHILAFRSQFGYFSWHGLTADCYKKDTAANDLVIYISTTNNSNVGVLFCTYKPKASFS